MNLDATIVDDRPGSIGRYRILSELGRGSMARVYLAQDPVVDRRIALKVISPAGPIDAVTWKTLRTRFLIEARAAGKLQHPNAVAIYDANTDETSGSSYIAMEWVDGRSLDQIINTRGPIDIDTSIRVVQQVAAALDAAHAMDLIHRDVKPANILVAKDGQAKLSDFGIVKFEDLKLTSTGGVMGTPLYMSPEQIRGRPLDGRSDLFSLGVVLYQCVTGHPPFSADTLAELTYQIQHSNPRAPQWVNPSIPNAVAAIIVKTLAKDPRARPQSGEELSRHLEMAVSGPVHLAESNESIALPTSTTPLSQSEIQSAISAGRRKQSTTSGANPPAKAPSRTAATLLLVGFVILALVAVLALLLDGSDLKHLLSSVGRASASPGTISSRSTTATSSASPHGADPRLANQKAESVPSALQDSSVASSGAPQEHALPPHEDAQPQPTQDDWVDEAEEVLDEAERLYKVSVGKGKEWWGRVGAKKNGKTKAKQGKKKDGH